jgi:hypothetical protein
MWVEAVLSKDDLVSLIGQIVPLTIRINPDEGGDHYIELATASSLELVSDQGLRMTTQARIHWPVLGIDVPIKVDPLTVMIKPLVTNTPGGDALSFTLEIERADFAAMPLFGDHALTDKINGELSKRHVEVAWAFASMLSHRFNLPPLLEPLDGLQLNVAWGKVRVTDEAMVLAISFHAQVSRHGEEVVIDHRTNGSALVLPPRRALAKRPVARRTPNLKRVALIGGTTLAMVGTYFAVRGAGRMGARLLRQAFPSRRGFRRVVGW